MKETISTHNHASTPMDLRASFRGDGRTSPPPQETCRMRTSWTLLPMTVCEGEKAPVGARRLL